MRHLPSAIASVLSVLALARASSADLILPPSITAMGHGKDPSVRAGYLDATLYGADPTGKEDSTKAIQAAINDGRDYVMTTYLPPGDYLVSDTLLGTEDGSGSGAAALLHQLQNGYWSRRGRPARPRRKRPRSSGRRPGLARASCSRPPASAGFRGSRRTRSPRSISSIWGRLASTSTTSSARSAA